MEFEEEKKNKINLLSNKNKTITEKKKKLNKTQDKPKLQDKLQNTRDEMQSF